MSSQMNDLTKMNVLSYEVAGELARVKVGDHLYEIKVGDSECTCTCSFFLSTQLPCRHVFYVLNQTERSLLLSFIPKRWTKEQNRMLQAVTSPPQFDVSKIERSGLTRNEKFREMDRLFKEMSSSCSEVGHRVLR